MTSPILPWICMNCTHNLLFKSGLLKLHCKAFPDGIPDEILFGKNDHIEPVIGDNGIQFDLISDVGVVKVAPNTYESVKQIDQYLNSSDTETINEYNEMMEGIQLVKLNANDCHNPAGSENGGQFCGSGNDYESIVHPIFGKEVPTYKTPHKNIKLFLSSVEPKDSKHIVDKVSKLLDTNDIELNELRFFKIGSTLAEYNGHSKVLTINSNAASEDFDKEQSEQGRLFKEQNDIYYSSNDILSNEKKISYLDSAIAHEEGHMVMWKNAILGGKTTEKLELLSKTVHELKPPKYTGFIVPKDIQEKQTLYKKAKTAQLRESNSFYTTREWSSLVKSELKSGWKAPSKYSKVDASEMLAECYSLHKYGADEYLTPKIIEFIDKTINKVRGSK